MDITTEKEGSKLTVFVSGKVDTATAPKLEEFIIDNTKDIDDLVLDLKGVDYVSSAGLRVFLQTQKLVNQKKAKMKILNVCQDVREIFDMVGFSRFIKIE